MDVSWPIYSSQCKSPLSAIARAVYIGRERWRSNYQDARQELDDTARELAQALALQRKLQDQVQALQAQLDQAHRKANEKAQETSIQLPPDPPVAGLQFGSRMIELTVNLARKIGFRPTVNALKIVFGWLKVKVKLPSKDTIRSWMQRLGVARMEKTPRLDDAVWLIDETLQLGKEKVLAVVAVTSSCGLAKQEPISQKDLHVLAFRPSTCWNQDEVAKVYDELSRTYGRPRAIVTDGGKNLQEAIKGLRKQGNTPLALRDLKHLMANEFEKLMTSNKLFSHYTLSLHTILSSVQQTELAHLAPPKFNRKARFMNLQKHLRWFEMILWQWKHPQSKARQNISVERMQEKFGWVKDYESEVKKWSQCQAVISKCLNFSNRHGIYRGMSKDLYNEVAPIAKGKPSKSLLKSIEAYLKEQEQNLRSHERLPISTEILESTFASYKQLEKQHSRGGFTKLVPAYAALLKSTTASEIRRTFGKVKMKDVQAWLQKNIPTTVTSRKQEAFRESRNENAQQT